MSLLGPDLRAQIVLSVREDWTYAVHDSLAERPPLEEAAHLVTVMTLAARDLGRKWGVALPGLNAMLGGG